MTISRCVPEWMLSLKSTLLATKLFAQIWLTLLGIWIFLHFNARLNSIGELDTCLSVSFRHRHNGSVIVRSSQPLVGMLGWRCQEDERLVAAISESCTMTFTDVSSAPIMETMHREVGEIEATANGACPGVHAEPSVLLVMDLRTYTATLGNRAKGGGCECSGECMLVILLSFLSN